ncbi:MAG TPA: hypothetical protein VK660_02265 [Xanthomonadaceae bacterium]|nr:hypothetical protein [Xanthomonadaceae bacterium]
MSKLPIAACLAVLCLARAFADDDPMASFYGNTIVSSGGAVQIRTHYHADHTFDFTGSMGFLHRNFKGTWALDGKGNLCRTYVGSVPPKTPNPHCTPFVPRKVGDAWKSKDNTYAFTLKPGIE